MQIKIYKSPKQTNNISKCNNCQRGKCMVFNQLQPQQYQNQIQYPHNATKIVKVRKLNQAWIQAFMNCKETFLFTYKPITTWTEVYHSCMNSTGKLEVFLFFVKSFLHICPDGRQWLGFSYLYRFSNMYYAFRDYELSQYQCTNFY